MNADFILPSLHREGLREGWISNSSFCEIPVPGMKANVKHHRGQGDLGLVVTLRSSRASLFKYRY